MRVWDFLRLTRLVGWARESQEGDQGPTGQSWHTTQSRNMEGTRYPSRPGYAEFERNVQRGSSFVPHRQAQGTGMLRIARFHMQQLH